MQKRFRCFTTALLTILTIILAGALLGGDLPVEAGRGVIFTGVTIDGIDLSGMTVEEAEAAVEAYLAEMYATPVTLVAAQGNKVAVQISEFSPEWSNREVISEIIGLAANGNVVQRYMMSKDIEVNGAVYTIELTYDEEKIRNILTQQCAVYDIPVENAVLIRENGVFSVNGGKAGEMLDVEASLNDIKTNLVNYYKEGTTEIYLVVNEEQPQGTEEELLAVKDVLGTYTTNYNTSGANRSANVANGCRLVNGTTIYPGEEFSMYNAVKPFSTDNGYYMAGSYLNGQVVDSLGGGICQVSSTLYNAVLLAELNVTERHPHSMIVTYVPRSADAAIAESSGKDFRFTNNTNHPIYIEGYTSGKNITFTIYGVEERSADRTVEYVSETLEQNVPTTEKIIADAGQGVGYISIQSAHIGYKARLWKVVYENGVEVSREEVNSSSYSMTPRTAVVGTNTDNPDFNARIQGAIASGSIDNCKAVANQILAEINAAAAAAAMAQQEPLPPAPEGEAPMQ